MAKDFKQGVLVWAKMKGFPPWPAKIAFPTDGKVPKTKRPQHFVYFFGTHDFAWIPDQHIVPHSEEMLSNAKNYKKKSSSMQLGLQEIVEACEEEEAKLELLTQKEPGSSSTAASPPPPEIIPEKTPKISKKKPVSKKKVKVEKKPAKRSVSVASNDSDNDVKVQVKNNEDSDEDYSLLIANVPPNNGYPNVAVIPPYSDDSKPSVSNSAALDSPLVSSSLVSNSTITKLQSGIHSPTSKKIGFLGLGMMGRELVKKMLSTGHSVTIWNRSVLDIFANFVEAGAKTAQNPAEVIQECDITFCCVTDAEASKMIVFGNNGVLAGLDGLCSNKAYVELTSIDPTTSQEIGEAITGKSGRFLEAPMIGSRQDISKSDLVIITAGDRSLFTDCNTVFASWAKHAFYLKSELGAANKMSLVLSMMAGTSYAALAESLAVIEKCNINPAFFLDIIANGPAGFPLLIKKGRSMISNDRTVYTSIKNQQKDLAMALELGHTSQQPLPLTVAANETYKRALRQDHDKDVSAIRDWLK